MTEPASDRPPATLSERFPVWNVLRGFRIAVHIPHVLLASFAVLILATGQRGIDVLPFAPQETATHWPWNTASQASGTSLGTWGQAQASSAWQLLTLPYRSVAAPAVQLMTTGNTLTSAAYHWTHLLWALVVWGFFGGAISRMSAINFATDRGVGVKTATRYARRRFLSFFSAPLLPIAGILVLWIVLLVGGLIGRIPSAGPFFVGIFWVVALIVGLVVALIAVGLFAGWPLMSPTIATEDSDAFDGFSRSFSYVFSRPRQGFGYLLVSVVYGMACVALVALLTTLVIHLAIWGVSSGMGTDEVIVLTAGSPTPDAIVNDDHFTTPLKAVPKGARAITAFWMNATRVLVQGFAVSLFWSLATIIYFLLRYSDDATSLDEVFLTAADEPEDLLPLVGVASSEQPVVERPLGTESGTPDDSTRQHPPSTGE